MLRIRKLSKTKSLIDYELGTITLDSLGDVGFIMVETDLGVVKIRMNIVQGDMMLESVEIQPNEKVAIIGDTMVVLKQRQRQPSSSEPKPNSSSLQAHLKPAPSGSGLTASAQHSM